MTADEKISQFLFQKTKCSWLLRHVGVFFASNLIWVSIGFVAGAVFVMTPAMFQTERFFRMIALVIFLVGSWLITVGIAKLTQRNRPYKDLGYEPIIKPFIETSSFPSAHATFAFALFGYSTIMGIQWLMWTILVVALLICLGRVMVGVHRVSEVLVGAFVGFAMTSIFSTILIFLLMLNT